MSKQCKICKITKDKNCFNILPVYIRTCDDLNDLCKDCLREEIMVDHLEDVMDKTPNDQLQITLSCSACDKDTIHEWCWKWNTEGYALDINVCNQCQKSQMSGTATCSTCHMKTCACIYCVAPIILQKSALILKYDNQTHQLDHLD